jgi:homoserine dehydrogenase
VVRLRVGLIGWGTVGSALGELVLTGPLPLDLKHVAVRDAPRQRPVPLPAGVPIVQPEDAQHGVDAVVELAGGVDEPRAWATATLSAGLAYVTANKALLATHGGPLAATARASGAALLASASVGGGVPMIEAVAHLASTGRVTRIRGVLNATTTFILSAMGAGHAYDEALRAAQDAGYAEADPTLDVSGRDAAQKLAILASVAWGRWRPEADVATGGIVGVELAAGSTVRLVAEATPHRLEVRPRTLDRDEPMARATGVENVLEVHAGDGGLYRASGPGAGGSATAGAVYADLARLVAGERPILFAPDDAPA